LLPFSIYATVEEFLTSINHFLTNSFPATAIIAIAIFFVKEFLEARRRKFADKRKIQALKKVLARECQINYLAIDRLNDALSAIQKAGISEDASRLVIEKSMAGGYLYDITSQIGSREAGILNNIQRDSLLKHLVEVAALDEKFYLTCETALDGLSEADHIFRSLVHGPAKHFPSTPENYFEGLAEYGLRELTDSLTALQVLYVACTGSVLQDGKLR